MSLTLEDFPAFYRDAHAPEGATDFNPFPWQVRLMKEVANGDWKEVLALPTSSGKTSVIDIAVFALALQADKPRLERTAPLRIFFIIDRRIVVDEATAHARELASKLSMALQPEAPDSALRRVAQALCSYGGEHPLHVVALRGGMYRDESWTRSPNIPTVCLSTVDQIGSRLLFRGYGIREFARPIHAGLVGNDALLIVDEGHLSNPFLETLKEVARYRGWAEQPVSSPWRVVQMSATPSAQTEVFKLGPEDEQNAILSKRLNASKLAILVEAKGEEFEARVVEQARKLAERDGVQVVGIVVNRVASARSIFEQMRLSDTDEAILLTGRIRPFDRDRLLEQWLERMRAGRKRDAAPVGKLFVVATQTVEVGANLDFDALVTEAASIDALRQRFGRLDRFGELEQSYAVIVLRKDQHWKDDAVYGEAIVKTWEWLKKNTRRAGRLKAFNFGIKAFDQTRAEGRGAFPQSAVKPAPVLFPSYVDTWVQTSPTPHADPDPAPFLHGADALDAVDVQIVWRDDLEGVPPGNWADIVALQAPTVREALPLPIWAARMWLMESGKAEIADVEGANLASSNGDVTKARPALCWRGADESEVVPPGQFAPGDTIVVPSSYGGADEFGWHQQAMASVKDIGDHCTNELAREYARAAGWGVKRRPFRLRLKLGGLLNETGDETEVTWPTLDEATINDLLSAYLASVEDNAENRFNLEAARILLKAKGRRIARYPQAAAGAIVVSYKPLTANATRQQAVPLASAEANDDHTDVDDTASTIGVQVTLKEHCRGVADWARKFAADCGLRKQLIDDLWLAGRLHDLGKADHRFQIWLHGGDEMAWADADEPIAKSGMQANDRAAMNYALGRSGYPKGARHELLSVALVEKYPDVLAQAHDPDLVLHLVGTHHGRARPFPPVIPDPEPVEVTVDLDGRVLTAMSAHRLENLSSGWVERFWSMVQRYGVWGLAYLETLLRLADYARSEEEQSLNGK